MENRYATLRLMHIVPILRIISKRATSNNGIQKRDSLLAVGLALADTPTRASTNPVHLETKIAGLNKLHIIIDVFFPEWLELAHGNIKPRLHIPVEVHHCSIANLVHADARIIAKSQNVP